MEVLLTEPEVNKKTRYRPFKRSFTRPTNTVTRFIFKVIDNTYIPKTNVIRHSNSRGGFSRKRYATIKGKCNIKRSNGNLI